MFNPNEHMMKLKGKDYLQVMWRLVWFREEKPLWTIHSDMLEAGDDHAIFKATICDENGVVKSTGHGSESKKDFGDYLEKAETKAVGRALAMLGYGTQFTATELDEGERIVDSPVDRAPRGSKEAAEDVGKAKLEQIEKKMAAQNAGKALATPEQIQWIKDNSDDATYLNAMQAFGPELERMTRGQADKLIARIKEGAA